MRCPNCGQELQLQQQQGLESKSATCPACNEATKVGDYLPKLCFCVNNNNYQLHLGSQWIGRKSSASQAEVQIPDETNYMSKKHALVTVTITANGYSCTFEEHGMNPTKLQNVPLLKDDIVYLNVGDCLELGGRKMYLAAEYGDE